MAPNFAYLRVSSITRTKTASLPIWTSISPRDSSTSVPGKTETVQHWNIAMEHLQEGDHLQIHSIDRMARNLQDLQSIVAELVAMGVAVTFKEKSDEVRTKKVLFLSRQLTNKTYYDRGGEERI